MGNLYFCDRSTGVLSSVDDFAIRSQAAGVAVWRTSQGWIANLLTYYYLLRVQLSIRGLGGGCATVALRLSSPSRGV
jgi:hypothetical protein